MGLRAVRLYSADRRSLMSKRAGPYRHSGRRLLTGGYAALVPSLRSRQGRDAAVVPGSENRPWRDAAAVSGLRSDQGRDAATFEAPPAPPPNRGETLPPFKAMTTPPPKLGGSFDDTLPTGAGRKARTRISCACSRFLSVARAGCRCRALRRRLPLPGKHARRASLRGCFSRLRRLRRKRRRRPVEAPTAQLKAVDPPAAAVPAPSRLLLVNLRGCSMRNRPPPHRRNR